MHFLPAMHGYRLAECLTCAERCSLQMYACLRVAFFLLYFASIPFKTDDTVHSSHTVVNGRNTEIQSIKGNSRKVVLILCEHYFNTSSLNRMW